MEVLFMITGDDTSNSQSPHMANLKILYSRVRVSAPANFYGPASDGLDKVRADSAGGLLGLPARFQALPFSDAQLTIGVIFTNVLRCETNNNSPAIAQVNRGNVAGPDFRDYEVSRHAKDACRIFRSE